MGPHFIPVKTHSLLLRLWHAWVAGGVLVAWMTADEDTYAMHLFSGYAVLAAIGLRLLMGIAAPPGSPLRLPRPQLQGVLAWWRKRQGRHPAFAWLAAALLLSVGLTALSGALADGTPWLEHPHEAIANLSLAVIGAHIVFVAFLYGGRRLLARGREALFPHLKEKTQ